jgi:2-methylcitrate dehydratase PrpD
MPFAQDLARLIERRSADEMTGAAIANAKTVILDTIGCSLARAKEPAVETLLATPFLTNPGDASLWGRGERFDALSAALVNGAAAHALDFDDVNIAMGGHPTAPVLAALQALCETQTGSGSDFLLAFLTGFETETRLARAVNFHHYDKGWHPTATLGVFGAAAACAKYLGLTTDQIAIALALSVSLSSGVKANFGTMTKPFHVGHAARHGLMAALLARQGFTASTEAFEHRQGFFNVFNGAGNFDPDRALEGWAAPWDIVDPGIGIKLYPCCDSTHCSIDTLLVMMREHAFAASDIARMTTLIHPLRLTHVDRPQLRNALDAKFSVQYCLARAAIDQAITFDSFEEASFQDPAAIELMSHVTARPHPDLSRATDGNYLTELTVHLKDGREFRVQRDRPFGRTADDPAPPALIESKFDACAAKAIPDAAARELKDAIANLEKQEDVASIARLWARDTA